MVEELVAVKKIQKGNCLYVFISKESREKLRLKAGMKVVEKLDVNGRRLIYELTRALIVNE